MDHMDWYFETDGDNLLFLRDQESLDESTVPDYWLQRGNTKSPKEFCFKKANSTGEEVNFDGQSLSYGPDKETSTEEREHSSYSSKCERFPFADYGGGNRESSLCRSRVLVGHPDYQLDGLSRLDQMDDIFLSSLLEEEPSIVGDPYQPVHVFSESERSTMPFDNLLTDMILDSLSISRDISGISSSKYTETCASPPSTVWDKVEDNPACFVQSDSEQMEGCSVAMVPFAQNSDCTEEDGEEKPLEESVLQELETVLTQLTQKTRICFRDAMYRLANSSEQRHSVSEYHTGEITMDEPSLSTVDSETLRFGRTRHMETETNAVDRTIASLMFNRLN